MNAIDIHNGSSIRKALKSLLGYNSRQVSVRVHSYSMGQTTHFTIRDESVDYKAVKEFASQCESVSRCKHSGEILSGGNTFTDVHINDEVKQAWAAPLVSAIASAHEALQALSSDGAGIPVAGLNLVIWKGQWDKEFYLTHREDMNSWRTPYRDGSESGFCSAAVDAYVQFGSDAVKG